MPITRCHTLQNAGLPTPPHPPSTGLCPLLVRPPQAGARAPVELVYGFTSAASGVLLDPITVRWSCLCWL